MANSVTARFNDDCKVFVSMSDDTTVEKAVIIDAEGNETDIGGGGGESDFQKVNVILKVNEGNTANFRIIFANPETDDVNGVYVTTEDNVRYISSNTHEIELGGESAEEIIFVAYCYLNNPIYALWLSSQSADDYTITGEAETSSFTAGGQTFYAVTISGDCTISVEGTK